MLKPIPLVAVILAMLVGFAKGRCKGIPHGRRRE